MGAIIQRELKNYFQTPLGYIFMGLFLIVSGFFFSYGNLVTRNPNFVSFLSNIIFIYIFAVPLLTMRLISEERRQRTDQLLLTSPITVPAIVLGKFLAAFIVFLFTVLVTVLYATVVGIYGNLAIAETIGGYLGFILIGGSFISIGVLISSVTESQVTAAFFTFFGLLFVWLIELVKQIVPVDPVSGIIFAVVAAIGVGLYFYFSTRTLLVGIIAAAVGVAAVLVVYVVNSALYAGLIENVLNWFSLINRFENFSLGILRLDSVVYYVSFMAVFLFLAMRIIEKKRWA